MDNLNLRNLQLSYEAVYDETLCESMDALGLFGEYDFIDEAMMPGPRQDIMRAKQYNTRLSARDRATAFNVGVRDDRPRDKRSTGGKGARFSDYGDRGAGNKARRRQGLPPMRGNTRQEEVELYDLILEYLLDEGYTDYIDGAEAIIENMSDEWLETILDEAVRGSQRSLANMITGEDIRQITRGGRTIYKKPKWQDRVHAEVRREMGKGSHPNPYQYSYDVDNKEIRRNLGKLNAPHVMRPMGDDPYRTVKTDKRKRKERASGR